MVFGPEEARRASARFEEIWKEAHEIGPAVQRLLEQATRRWEKQDGWPLRDEGQETHRHP
jgi:hypothetical protein